MSLVAVGVIVLLAGYAVFIAWLMSIAFGGSRKKRSESPDTNCRLCVFIDDMEDCDYEMFWQTQVPFLEMIRSAGPEGVRLEEIKHCHCSFARSYPELCDGSGFSDWVAALESAEVVTTREGSISMTEKGRFILESVERKHEASRA